MCRTWSKFPHVAGGVAHVVGPMLRLTRLNGWMCRLGQDVVAVDFARAEWALPLCLFPCLQAQGDELCVGYRAAHVCNVHHRVGARSGFVPLICPPGPTFEGRGTKKSCCKILVELDLE